VELKLSVAGHVEKNFLVLETFRVRQNPETPTKAPRLKVRAQLVQNEVESLSRCLESSSSPTATRQVNHCTDFCLANRAESERMKNNFYWIYRVEN
jgi:hypothetical protein